jgi:hypothetical protein
MRKPIIFFLFLFCALSHSVAQQSNPIAADEHRFSHTFGIGYNIGGLAPVSFPNNIRKIKSFSPGFSPNASYQISYSLSRHWAIGTGVRMDWKAMKVSDSVQYFHTLVSMDTSTIEGDFTGTNTTDVRNIYISLPVNISYSTNNNWKLKLGVYFAYLVRPRFSGSVSDGYLRKGNSLGEKVMINYATFNFDDKQRKFDFGISAGAEKLICQNFGASFDLQWGLIPAFPVSFTGISFKMYNIYGSFGVFYRI